MTPSEQCKAAGLKSLAELAKISGVSVQTLINWSRDKRTLFATVVAGSVVIKEANVRVPIERWVGRERNNGEKYSMKNYRLTVDLQMNSDETVVSFANVLSKTMELTAQTTIDICTDAAAHVILGKTNIERVESFTANKY